MTDIPQAPLAICPRCHGTRVEGMAWVGPKANDWRWVTCVRCGPAKPLVLDREERR